MKKDLLKQAFETIAFQNGNFGKELQLLVSELRKKDLVSKEAQKLASIRNIELFVLDRTGININLMVDTEIDAAVELPLLNLNHIFFNDFIKEFTKDEVRDNLTKIKNKEKVILDLSNSKISGPTTKIASNLYLSWDKFIKKDKFTDEEVTAIFLHELGHVWTTFEYLNRLSTTNEALLTVSNAFLNGDKNTYEIELKKVAKKLFNKEDALNNLKEVTNLTVIGSVILTTELKNRKSDLGTPYYDSVSCEYLADQFVSRHHYGKYLVSGLDKMYSRLHVEKSKGMAIFSDITTSLALVVTTATISVGSPMTIFIGLFYYYLVFISNKITSGEPSYDNLKIRYQRVLDQIILDLKNKGYNKEQLSEKLEDFNKVSKYVENTFEPNSLFSKIIRTLLPGESKAKKALDLQRDLEELASNELFVQSAKLRTMLT